MSLGFRLGPIFSVTEGASAREVKCYFLLLYIVPFVYLQCTTIRHFSSRLLSATNGFSALHVKYLPSSSLVGVSVSTLSDWLPASVNYGGQGQGQLQRSRTPPQTTTYERTCFASRLICLVPIHQVNTASGREPELLHSTSYDCPAERNLSLVRRCTAMGFTVEVAGGGY